MPEIEKTEEQLESFINAYIKIEVDYANDSLIEWPSLFSNIIEPWKKDFSSARLFYKSLTTQQIQMRFEIQRWERDAWSRYEVLMGCSLMPLSKSIDAKLWAKKEIINVELLLNEGKNQLMKSGANFCLEEIPEVYNQLITGDWENFIVMEEINRYKEAESNYLKDAESKYFKDNDIDPSDINSIRRANLFIFLTKPQEEEFLNKNYIAAKQIQALLWYKEFLTEVTHIGISFFDEDVDDDQQTHKSKRKWFSIKNLQRKNDGYEAIKASFDDFLAINDRTPKWSELMDYMAKHPPHGFTVKASYKGHSVSELLLEGVEKLI
ncbi:MAG: hypothetical protein ACXWC7_20580, partial [Chitinophagaceae bacterium]